MAEVVAERRTSVKAYIGHVVLAAFLGLILAVLTFLIPFPGPLFAPLGFLLPLGTALWAWIARMSSCFRLHKDRLETESGILARRIENIELFRIRDVGLQQGIVGRLGDFGDVVVHSTDSSSPEVRAKGIDAPRQFYQELRELVTESRAQHQTMIVEHPRDQAGI